MQYARPPFRPLRAYAFTPASDLDLDQAIGNEVSLMVPWEDQQPGPVGEYVEVVDFDRESECFYLRLSTRKHQARSRAAAMDCRAPASTPSRAPDR